MIKTWMRYAIVFLIAFFLLAVGYVWASTTFGTIVYDNKPASTQVTNTPPTSETEVVKELRVPTWPEILDIDEYNRRILNLVGYIPAKSVNKISTTTDADGAISTSTELVKPASPLKYSSSTNVTIEGKKWPIAGVYPNGGAVLPFKRILAYYGNFYSRQMGILGELEPDDMLAHLARAQAEWEKADPDTPVLPAIEYIVMVAQADGGSDGMYRAVMPEKEVEKAYALAQKIDGVMILDIQVGLSNVQAEMPKFKKYLERPDVYFAVDPEFSMKNGEKPGTVIGTFNANDINYVIDYMADIVKEKQLPPKVLLIHRFTQNMVTGVAQIKSVPEVQVVMVMDGWGSKDLKRGTYSHIIEPEPVQFAGIKLFYKNDLKPPSTGLLTPAEVLNLHPKPIYVQYQ